MSSDDENALPSVPTRLASPPLFSDLPLRKRSRGYDSSNSSDAPLFSSDDLAEASSENYQSPRRKKLNRRTWWEDEPSQVVHRKQIKRHAQRFHDSGVFMSSDSSSSNEDGFSVEHLPVKGHRRQITKIAIAKPPEQQAQLQGEDRAAQLILDTLEANSDTVDLSNIALCSISNEILRPLRNLICLPKNQHLPAEEGSYQSFAPRLKLFFSNNQLQHMPSEILNLHKLTVLSLRHNQITELPHSMGKLVSLVDLNVAGNQLRWLPGEILTLVRDGKLTNLHVHPNPLLQAIPRPQSPGSIRFASNLGNAQAIVEGLECRIQSMIDDVDEQMRWKWIANIQKELANRMARVEWSGTTINAWARSGTERHAHLIAPWKREPIYLGSTQVTFYDFDGSVPRTSHPAPSRLPSDIRILPVATTADDLHPSGCQLPAQGHVQSLFELAARACCKYLPLPTVEELFGDQGLDSITHALSEVRDVVDEGGRQCSICRRCFVIPRAEWIEYWHCAPDSLTCAFDEFHLPFLKRACSWACAGQRRLHTNGPGPSSVF